ncbi:hypothetical protein NX722_22955 [Endozoicomonas gorgoniicola]|uniref:Uncharacterized protein n=1 Tax=Endozoicomonas gorgoniicola TaxID=1234144 RepID=A0ABT3N1B9_9GAMM|nr:hypothetical protein [Endozoicomonas gorgoniicola]MCW7555432.1 hypothetical protein [Endozoicomonas gorgoniicola]
MNDSSDKESFIKKMPDYDPETSKFYLTKESKRYSENVEVWGCETQFPEEKKEMAFLEDWGLDKEKFMALNLKDFFQNLFCSEENSFDVIKRMLENQFLFLNVDWSKKDFEPVFKFIKEICDHNGASTIVYESNIQDCVERNVNCVEASDALSANVNIMSPEITVKTSQENKNTWLQPDHTIYHLEKSNKRIFEHTRIREEYPFMPPFKITRIQSDNY